MMELVALVLQVFLSPVNAKFSREAVATNREAVRGEKP